jgi:hypothetical protein
MTSHVYLDMMTIRSSRPHSAPDYASIDHKTTSTGKPLLIFSTFNLDNDVVSGSSSYQIGLVKSSPFFIDFSQAKKSQSRAFVDNIKPVKSSRDVTLLTSSLKSGKT